LEYESTDITTSAEPVRATRRTRFAGNPVLSMRQSDVRDFEKKTLYKSNIIWDKSESMVYRFFMFYNGKIKNGYERIGMAVSADMINWSRYGTEPGVVGVCYGVGVHFSFRYGMGFSACPARQSRCLELKSRRCLKARSPFD